MASKIATTNDKTYVRRDGQWSELYLYIDTPPSVFTARLTSAPGSTDQVVQISYNTGSGSGALAGMTIAIGTSAGAYDKGLVRLRNTPSLGATGTLDIGEESEINFANGDYLSVWDDFGLWERRLRLVGNTPYADYDIAYSDQHTAIAPVICAGPPLIPVWLSAASIAVPFSASETWVIGGGAITYSWSASGGSLSGATTATPTLTLTAAGRYRVACTATANGKSTVQYFVVRVFTDADPPITQFIPTQLPESSDEGYTFSVTAFAEVSTVRDRSLCVLFTKDYYGATQVSIGPLANRENILAWGWVNGKSIDWNPEQASVTFTVAPTGFWLNQITSRVTGQEHTNDAPTAWTQFQNLTVDKALWHLLYWRSTIAQCVGFSLTGNTWLAPEKSAPEMTLWEQLTTLSSGTLGLLAVPRVDRYGRLYIEIDAQYIPEADRAGVEVMELTTADWLDALTFDVVIVPPTSKIDLSGVYFDGYTPSSYFSLSPGRVFKRHGRVETLDRLVLTTQAQANELAGLVLGQRNNDLPNLSVRLAGNNRLLDTAPAQYVVLSLAASDTPSGYTFTARRFLVRRVSYEHDPESGMLMASCDLEAETFAQIAVTGDYPSTPPDLPDGAVPNAPATAASSLVYIASE